MDEDELEDYLLCTSTHEDEDLGEYEEEPADLEEIQDQNTLYPLWEGVSNGLDPAEWEGEHITARPNDKVAKNR